MVTVVVGVATAPRPGLAMAEAASGRNAKALSPPDMLCTNEFGTVLTIIDS